MAYQDYQLLHISVENRICRATIDNPLGAVARAKRAVDAAAGDLVRGLSIEDQLFRETLAGPAVADRMAAFMARGGVTREYELGDNPF